MAIKEFFTLDSLAEWFYRATPEEREKWVSENKDKVIPMSKNFDKQINLLSGFDKERALSELNSEGKEFLNDLVTSDSISSFKISRSVHEILIDRLKLKRKIE